MTQRLTAALWKQLLARTTGEHRSLQTRIREMLVRAILDGQLAPNAPLPSSREMAEQLGVSRNTVVLAYLHLADEGYLLTRERSGHFVNPAMLEGRVRADAKGVAPPAAGTPPDWAARIALPLAGQRSIVKPADWQRYPYPFIYGQLDASLFPKAEWRECCMRALGVVDIREWAPDQITLDDEALVQQIRTRVLPRRGVWAGPDEVIVTVGSQHALYR